MRDATRRVASRNLIGLAWLGLAFGWLGLNCVFWGRALLGVVFAWLGLVVVVQGCATRRVASRSKRQTIKASNRSGKEPAAGRPMKKSSGKEPAVSREKSSGVRPKAFEC